MKLQFFFKVKANFGCISAKQLAYKDGAGRRFLTRATKDVDEIRPFILDMAQYRRLHILRGREGWQINPKRVYRLYTEEGLTMRRKRVLNVDSSAASAKEGQRFNQWVGVGIWIRILSPIISYS